MHACAHAGRGKPYIAVATLCTGTRLKTYAFCGWQPRKNLLLGRMEWHTNRPDWHADRCPHAADWKIVCMPVVDQSCNEKEHEAKDLI